MCPKVSNTMEGPVMHSLIARFVKDGKGVSAIEYGLIAAAMALMLVVTMPGFSNAVRNHYDNMGNVVENAMP